MFDVESLVPSRLAVVAGSFAARDRLLVLCYHGIDDADAFRRQMDELVGVRNPVTLDAVMTSLRTGVPLAPRSVLVTFDDGDRTVLDAGLPILSSRSIPAALFVVSGLIGTDQPFWWDEVADLTRLGGVTGAAQGDAASVVRQLKRVPNARRLSAIEELRASAGAPAPRRRHLTQDELVELDGAGVTIGSHTTSHPCLDQCEPDTISEELTSSRAQLEAILGREVRAFAYPNGNTDAVVRDAVQRAGYEVAFGFDHRLTPNPTSDLLHVSRIRVDASAPIRRFRLLISGAHSAVHHARGRS